MTINVFVLGLDEHNERILRDLPGAEQYRFHSLLSVEALLRGEEISLRDLLDKAAHQLEDFEGSIDAIIGFWDFPVSSMVPILCHRFGDLCCASLEAVVKCEHKYWSRLEQQKVIEEYSSPALRTEQEESLKAAAIRLKLLSHYRGAATVEFLYEPEPQRFSFMEVNARLQVEHPVTEAVTGLDLVKLQLHIAQLGTRRRGDRHRQLIAAQQLAVLPQAKDGAGGAVERDAKHVRRCPVER